MNFYFFGDSICFGQYVSVEKAWVHKTAEWLNKTYSDNEYTVMNPSIIGNTTRDALIRYYQDVLTRNPDIIYVQFGMNDCNIWDTERGIQRVMPKTFEANLTELYVRSQTVQCKKFMVGTNHPSYKNPNYDERNKEYNEIIRKISKQNKRPIIDHEQYWINSQLTPSEYLLSDGVHLNHYGHIKYYHKIITDLKNIL
jgi:lysophospholipase L1-like esterase